MHRNDHPTATGGMHHKGDPQRNVPATVVTHDMMNALQEEVVSVILACGIVLDKADNTQLLQSILQLIGSTLTDGDFVTRPELGNAAYKDVGAGAAQVAVGNHGHADLTTLVEFNGHVYAADPHTQYVLKALLGNAAYQNVGMSAGQVAPGDHTHPQFGQSARAYYSDVYAHGATDASQALAIAASALPIKSGDTLLVRWQQYYEYGTGNGTAGAYRSVYTYWLSQGGAWYVITERL